MSAASLIRLSIVICVLAAAASCNSATRPLMLPCYQSGGMRSIGLVAGSTISFGHRFAFGEALSKKLVFRIA
jgi:hypothetical protein